MAAKKPTERTKKTDTQPPDDKKRPATHENAEGRGAAFNEQDPKRRLGGYGGAGEHPRT